MSNNFQILIQSIKNSKMPTAQQVGCLAQAIIESGRGTSKLFKECLNPFGIKYREELKEVAVPFEILVPSEQFPVKFAKFHSIEASVVGYEIFIKRVPYIGYTEHLQSPENYIQFIGRIYAGDPDYSRKVISVIDEAEFYLNAATEKPKEATKVISEKWLRLTKTKEKLPNGLTKMVLDVMGLIDGEAVLLDSVPAISGAINSQIFQTAAASPSGSARPLGEGYYTVGKVEWAGGKDNWIKVWHDNGNGIGPIWQTITCLSKTSRSSLGIHLDWNAQNSPGTLGCIGLASVAEAKNYVKFADAMPLTVNWGLGTVETLGIGPRGRAVKVAPVSQPKPTPSAPTQTPAPAPIPKPPMEKAKQLNGVKIGIDVGHGYYETNDVFDPGAKNGQIREFDLNLQTANAVKSYLENEGAIVNVFSYEQKGSGLSLTNKGRKAKGHDIFISLHHNSGPSTAQGAEVLVEDDHWTIEDKELASMILQGIVAQTKLISRGVKSQGLGVLTGAHGLCRAKCLVESFFISDSKMTPEFAESLADQAAAGICNGIYRYIIENKIAKA